MFFLFLAFVFGFGVTTFWPLVFGQRIVVVGVIYLLLKFFYNIAVAVVVVVAVLSLKVYFTF